MNLLALGNCLCFHQKWIRNKKRGAVGKRDNVAKKYLLCSRKINPYSKNEIQVS